MKQRILVNRAELASPTQAFLCGSLTQSLQPETVSVSSFTRIASWGQSIIFTKFLLKCKYVIYEKTCTDISNPISPNQFVPPRGRD